MRTVPLLKREIETNTKRIEDSLPHDSITEHSYLCDVSHMETDIR